MHLKSCDVTHIAMACKIFGPGIESRDFYTNEMLYYTIIKFRKLKYLIKTPFAFKIFFKGRCNHFYDWYLSILLGRSFISGRRVPFEHTASFEIFEKRPKTFYRNGSGPTRLLLACATLTG